MQLLSEQPQTVDFSHYRSILKNTAIVDDLEKQVNGYQVKKYDVSRQIKAIEAFEVQAVKSAEETKGKVDMELKDLEKTLKNIEEARPFEDLTVVRHCPRATRLFRVDWVSEFVLILLVQDEVAAARPDIDERVSQLVSKGRWHVPGYKVRFISSAGRRRIQKMLIPVLGEVWRSLCAVNAFVLLGSFA